MCGLHMYCYSRSFFGCQVADMFYYTGVTCVHITDEVNGLDWTTFIGGLKTFASAS